MKKHQALTFSGLFGALLLAASPALADTRTYDLSDFDEIDVSAGVSAVVSVGGAYSIEIEADDDVIDEIRAEVKSGTLVITRRSSRMNWGGKRSRVRATISLPALSGVEASSGASIDADGIDAGRFSAEASSGASIDVKGTCESIAAEASSGARIRANDLTCENAAADVSSGASIKLFARTKASGDASSGGSIRFYGSPQDRSTDKSSGGSIRFVD